MLRGNCTPTRHGLGHTLIIAVAILLGAALLNACGSPAAQITPSIAATLPAHPTAQPTAQSTAQPVQQPSATIPLTMSTAPEPARPFDPEETPLRLETVADGFTMPVFLTNAGDGSGRLFVLEKAGRVRVIEGGKVIDTPFLDITDRVGSSSSEQGLLGLAFAPDYIQSGLIYVNYTNVAGDTVISRFKVTTDPMVADAAGEKLVIGFAQPAVNHNGGMLAFGPDGMLWIGTGDGGAANDKFGNGQNPQTLLGKMLRLDVTSDLARAYMIPADNPWVTKQWNGQDVRGEIWALGLRNPWRFSFDRATDDLWIADVGQNTYEEINLVPAGSAGGLNFGWPIMEGLHCFQSANCDASGLVKPIIEYDHSGNCSVTGGYVYRGESPALQGVYFYADYCSMRIWAATPALDGSWSTAQVLQGESPITSWGEDEQGELYVVESNGRISRLTP